MTYREVLGYPITDLIAEDDRQAVTEFLAGSNPSDRRL